MSFAAALRLTLAGLLIEWLCGLFGEPDREVIKAFLVAEIVRRRAVAPNVAWAWVDGSAEPAAEGQA